MEDEKKPGQRDAEFEIPSSIDVPLKKPLKKLASDETLTTLAFRPPTVDEMKQIEERGKKLGDASAGIFMLSILSEDKLTTADVGRMNFIDMQICVEKLKPFLQLEPLSEEKD